MLVIQATVRNEFGIHVRPSGVIAKEARNYSGRIEVVSAKGATVDAKNVLGLLSLGITCGQIVTLRVDGPDEAKMAARMVELFETYFDFRR